MTLTNKKISFFFLINILLIVSGLILSITLGAVKINLQTIWDSFFHYEAVLEMQLVRDVRLPRALSSLMVGGLLATTGALMQGVTRNPIAEPSLLGISQGGTLAVAILLASQTISGTLGTMSAALIGAFLSGLLIIGFTLKNPSHMSMGKLLLLGTSLSTFFISIASVIALLTNKTQLLGFWVAGGFRGADWNGVWLLLVISLISFAISLFIASKINIISLGDDVATSFGINAVKVRFFVLLLIIPMVAASVAVGKNIAFVGLIIPQITKRIVGEDYRKIIPSSFLLGSVLLVFSDLIARIINLPYETPIGIFTSLIGIPFYIILVRKEKA